MARRLRSRAIVLATAALMTLPAVSPAVAPLASALESSVPAPANTQDESGYFTSVDGVSQIFFQKQTVPNARGTVVVVHGAAEYSARYDYVANRLLQAGYNVYRMDHRGHGRSASEFKEGNPVGLGHIDDFQLLVDDLNLVVQRAKAENPGLKTFMLGHSMGALASQFYGIKYPNQVDGFVTNGGGAPLNLSGRGHQEGATITPDEITEAQRQLAPTISEALPLEQLTSLNTMMAQTLIPYRTDLHLPNPAIIDHLKLPNPASDGVASNPAVMEEYASDPHIASELTIGFTLQLVYSAIFDAVNADLFTAPTLVMAGTKDGLVPSYFSQDWYNAINSQDKQLVFWEGQMHEVFNEPAQGQAMDTAIEWINAHNA